MNRYNLQWAAKLLRAKNFVVLTDTDSVINLDGVEPRRMKSVLMLTAQKRALSVFQAKLQKLIEDHDKHIAIMGGAVKHVTSRTQSRKTKTSRPARRQPKKL